MPKRRTGGQRAGSSLRAHSANASELGQPVCLGLRVRPSFAAGAAQIGSLPNTILTASIRESTF